MIRDALAHLNWTIMPVISMMLFMSVFFGALIWVFRKDSGKIYAELGQLPLKEDAHHE